MNPSITITPEMSAILDKAWEQTLIDRARKALADRPKQGVLGRVGDAIRRLSGLLVTAALANTTQTGLVTLYFNNTASANIGNSGGLQPSSAAGSFYLSLHTANPGTTGTQTTSEAAYTSYARVAVARSSAGWTVTGNQPCTAENAAAATFPAATGGSETETYFGIGTASTGTGQLIISAALTSSLAVSTGITPSFAINACQFNAT